MAHRVEKQTNAPMRLYQMCLYVPHLVAVVLATVGAVLPFSLSFSIIHTSPNAASYEEIVACSYLQALQYDATFFVPVIVVALMVLLTVAVALSHFMRNRVIDIAMTALSAASLISVLSLIFLQGLERFTPTSLTMAFLLLCSLVISVQHLTGCYFIDPTKEDD